ncbi:MAG: hypothetical protein ACPGPF_07370, partial [Pontibacterium sp.]
IPDEFAQHSAGGLLHIAMTASNDSSQGKRIITPASNVQQSPPPPPLNAQTVLPETVSFYRQQIDKALANKNIEKALQLANEAQHLGLGNMRTYVIEQLHVR